VVITMAGTLVVLLACLPLHVPMSLSCIYVLTCVSYWLEEKKYKEAKCLVVPSRPFIVFLSEVVLLQSAVMGNMSCFCCISSRAVSGFVFYSSSLLNVIFGFSNRSA
jgi:hypothetical protein